MLINKLSSQVLSCLVATILLIGGLVYPVDQLRADERHVQTYEPAVLEVVEFIKTGDLELALVKVNAHLEEFPKSRVGHFLKAEILAGMAQPLLEVDHDTIGQADAIKGLKHQIQNRWKHVKSQDNIAHTHMPSNMIDMGNHKYVIVADMQEGRLYLYKSKNGLPTLVRDYYLTVGSAGYGKESEGDNKTPVGVYSIYRYIDDEELPDLYGEGAFPVDYPNRLDRFKKRTGYGIWLHGTPSNTYARSPWASEGCFVLSNEDFLEIQNYIDIKQKTPVILSDKIEWITAQELTKRRNEYLVILDNWKKDWESLESDAYLSHYSVSDFNFGSTKFNSWAERKREVNEAKTFVQVDMDIKSLFTYPGETDMFVVKYTQRYFSNNYQGEADKEQYWQRDEAGQWKIIFEG